MQVTPLEAPFGARLRLDPDRSLTSADREMLRRVLHGDIPRPETEPPLPVEDRNHDFLAPSSRPFVLGSWSFSLASVEQAKRIARPKHLKIASIL